MHKIHQAFLFILATSLFSGGKTYLAANPGALGHGLAFDTLYQDNVQEENIFSYIYTIQQTPEPCHKSLSY